jgi:hypothetical protein
MSYLDGMYHDFTRLSDILLSLIQKTITELIREPGHFCRELRFAKFFCD